MGSVAPDQSMCNSHRWGARPDQQQATARIRARGSAAPANSSDTTHHVTAPRPLTWSSPKRGEHQTSMAFVPKWCYTT